MNSPVTASVISDLVPTGTLRVGINASNFLLVSKYTPGSDPYGIAPDLGRELAQKLDLPRGVFVFELSAKTGDGMEPWIDYLTSLLTFSFSQVW